jgi:hypothetical protein
MVSVEINQITERVIQEIMVPTHIQRQAAGCTFFKPSIVKIPVSSQLKKAHQADKAAPELSSALLQDGRRTPTHSTSLTEASDSREYGNEIPVAESRGAARVKGEVVVRSEGEMKEWEPAGRTKSNDDGLGADRHIEARIARQRDVTKGISQYWRQ